MTTLSAQENSELPYYELPPTPKTYTGETVAARMIDGLGFRYYWATEGLKEQDLSFKPSEDARTSRQTIDHIYGLVGTIVKSLQESKGEIIQPADLSFEEVRAVTLRSIKEASDLLLKGRRLEDSKIVFRNGSEFPFWNNINGPISDAIWHVGQVVSFRRSSGNPYNNKASVFSGKVRK